MAAAKPPPFVRSSGRGSPALLLCGCVRAPFCHSAFQIAEQKSRRARRRSGFLCEAWQVEAGAGVARASGAGRGEGGREWGGGGGALAARLPIIADVLSLARWKVA